MISSPRSAANGTLITVTLSPRLASKPTASCTRRVKRARSSAPHGARVASPVAGSILTWSSTTTATDRRVMRPCCWRVWLMERSSSKFLVLCWRLSDGYGASIGWPVAGSMICWPLASTSGWPGWMAAAGVAAPPVVCGAEAGPGGWLLSAPGTPCGPWLLARCSSTDCSLRSAGWSGLNCSEVDSTALKSRSADTSAL
ncbi:hypothetical protein D3C76_784660 [compost metagenome]